MKIASLYLQVFSVICSVLELSAQIPLNPAPTRVVGQTSLSQGSLNLVEGREFNSPQGIALDLSQNPPALYVADTFNNRVLGFRDSSAFANGQKADIVIGQVDFQTTTAQGPRGGGARNSGLAQPVGLAVDQRGNLYVVDAGNNRILRFPNPLQQAAQLPDLVVGQLGFTTRDPNLNGISARTLAFSNQNSYSQAYIAFDGAGNLWATDPGNNRVLRYPAALLGVNAVNGPSADLVLGQLDFATNAPNQDQTSLTFLASPTGIVFDQAGRLFVSESQATVRSRIVIYAPPFGQSGQAATRILGVVPSNVVPQPPGISEQQFRPSSGGLFLINNGVGIADTQNNRLLAFKPVDQFTANVLTQQAQSQYLVGQTDFSSGFVNQGQPEAGPNRLALPSAVAVSATELFVADTGNNRVIVMPYSASGVGVASRVLGQDQLTLNSPNLVEGREFRFVSGSGPVEGGIVTDLRSNPPHLYVADTYNNRVLGFRDLRTVKPGDRADLVIGQPDFAHTQINYPTNSSDSPNASSLYNPTGLALDAAGNLYVADSGNGRVLRFADPFGQTATLPAANLVLGQRNFTSKIQDAFAFTMGFPYGLAFATNNGLLVSDAGLNRVLYFAGTPGSFTNGQSASLVIGQPDFSSSAASSGPDNRFNTPRGISTDADDRLYVADTNNNRVVIFERVTGLSNDPRPSRVLGGLQGARDVYVNPSTQEIWVASANGNALTRFANFNSQPVVGLAPTATIGDGFPVAVTQDAYGNLYTADGSNRIQINYPALSTVSAASFLQNQPLAPGSIATIFSLFLNQFGTATATAAGTPLPTQLAGIQVLFNNTPAPLYYVGPNQINFVLPQNAPTTGTGDLLVTRTDTGQILGNFPLPLNSASPAIFTLNATTPGAGQAAAINQDGSVNAKDHPAPNGSVVAFFGTGEGLVPGAPPDGVPSTGAVPTAIRPTVLIGTKFVPDANVQYSGLAPGLVGVWQVNVLIPEDVASTDLVPNTPVVFLVNGIVSSQAPRLTTFWVTGKK